MRRAEKQHFTKNKDPQRLRVWFRKYHMSRIASSVQTSPSRRQRQSQRPLQHIPELEEASDEYDHAEQVDDRNFYTQPPQSSLSPLLQGYPLRTPSGGPTLHQLQPHHQSQLPFENGVTQSDVEEDGDNQLPDEYMWSSSDARVNDTIQDGDNAAPPLLFEKDNYNNASGTKGRRNNSKAPSRATQVANASDNGSRVAHGDENAGATEEASPSPRKKRGSGGGSPSSRKNDTYDWSKDAETLDLATDLGITLPQHERYKQVAVQSLSSFHALALARSKAHVFVVFSVKNCEYCDYFLPHLEYAARVAGNINSNGDYPLVFAKMELSGKALKELQSQKDLDESSRPKGWTRAPETEDTKGLQSLYDAVGDLGTPFSVLFPHLGAEGYEGIVYPKAVNRDPFTILGWLATKLNMPALTPLAIDFTPMSTVTETTKFAVFYNGLWSMIPSYAHCLTADLVMLDMRDVQQYILFTLLRSVPADVLQASVAFVDISAMGYYDAVTILSKDIALPNLGGEGGGADQHNGEEDIEAIPFTGWMAVEFLHKDVLPTLLGGNTLVKQQRGSRQR